MAVKDAHGAFVLSSDGTGACDESRDARIHQFFAELAREEQLDGIELRHGNEPSEEFTVVYDKFAGRAR
jgi:hypothetical protein